jgi:hypothetical protein
MKNEAKGKTGTPKKVAKKPVSSAKTKTKASSKSKDITPMMVSEAQATRTRSNKSAYIERQNRFTNIEEGLVPFKYSKGTTNLSNLDVRDAVILCQKAYYNFAVFRNTIDLMTEFTISPIYFKGGSKKSRSFFEALFKKINLYDFQDKFFREFYRSGNVFTYRFETDLKNADVKKISRTYGAKAKSKVKIPSRYMLLNPADIQVGGNISYRNSSYFKVLSRFEVQRLKNPRTEEDKEVYDALPEEVKRSLSKGSGSVLAIPIDNDKLIATFYKKQDYEPLSIPMGFPVLEDLNWKQEMKKMDMAITRTTQQAILLITMGSEPEKGGINQKNLAAMQDLFVNESVGRVLIADYTTKAEFVIPNIADILDPKKYEVVNTDIQMGLNNVLFGSERFANQMAKTEMFLARLRQSREVFLNEFLMPEIKRISKEIGFRDFPEPEFDAVTLRDETNLQRIYSRLIEVGVLTPEEGLEALKKNRLPEPEDSVESQKGLLKLKEDGLYEPLVGPGAHPGNVMKEEDLTAQPPQEKKSPPQPNGRPPGSGSPQTTKKITPIGQGPRTRNGMPTASVQFSLSKVHENMLLAQKLSTKVGGLLKTKHKIKRLSAKQKNIVEQIVSVVIANEAPEKWVSKAKEYVAKPIDQNKQRAKEVQQVAYEHQVDDYLAGILFASKS